ncbi:MAG: PQQ-binding-like beta-propeller repeat protein [Acidobacteria bacterium]|nr:PQQ-binding-like beta-propeller repeat protein [Acidobacteriota bacterium]
MLSETVQQWLNHLAQNDPEPEIATRAGQPLGIACKESLEVMTQFSLGGFASTSRISGFVLNFLVALGWLTISGHQLHAASFDEGRAGNWHQWRGPEANGVSRTASPPVEWSETKNVQWKVAVPGNGSSAPIIWGNKVFLLTSINTGKVDPSLPKPEDQPKRVFGITHPNTSYEFVVLCLDRASGRELWRRMATQTIPHEGHHGDNNFASASPVTDGERLHCWFGSAGLFCYDLEGKKLWERNLGNVKMGASLGEGSSPALHDGKLVIVRDHQGQSTIETLDAKTGVTLWKENRDEGNTWATPLIVNHNGQTQVITPGSKKIRSYDLRTGHVLWQCGGLTGNAIPCPVVEGSLVYCMTGYEGHALLALPLSATGDISDSDQIAWSQRRGTPYIPSPVLYDGLLWFNQSNQSLWSCLDARTGEVLLKFLSPGQRPGLAGR